MSLFLRSVDRLGFFEKKHITTYVDDGSTNWRYYAIT